MKRTFQCITLLTLLGVSVNHLAAAPEKDESSSQNIFQQLDKNSDGIVTAEEVPDEKSRFFDHLIRQGDQNKDGKLTKAEFEAGLKKEDQKFPAGDAPRGNRNRGPRDMKKFWSRLDRNGDKKISKEELPEPMRARMEPLFQRLNTDEISLEEFEKFGNRFKGNREGGKPPGNRPRKPGDMQAGAERFFDRLDTNKDGKLTLEESPERGKPIVRRLLEKSGKGEDAELTKEEFKKEFAAFRPDRRRPDRENDKEMKRPEMRDQQKKQPGEPARRRPGSSFFQTIDLDNDGKLSKYELNQIDRVFDRLDRNRNGYLELEEVVGQQRRGRINPVRIGAEPQKENQKTESKGKKASE
ncbi:hypothetical protein [uncultured Gimesia sp.]|uniref:EF-hand domain-containing protein n=1 Tax=uncultured Gimesia sp. TaxID=1678688 RepID=UPI0030DCD381|tara:strand:- start:106550 stop:107611 length:1062 start_codon:yes stop_codon:yes gene_type:complete